MAQFDIKIDDPFTDFGDLNIQNSDYQHIESIMYANKGHFYQWPLLGVGIFNYINAPDDLIYLKSTVLDELNKDNYVLTEYEAYIENSVLKIQIDATYIL